jgi:hypothetical protein
MWVGSNPDSPKPRVVPMTAQKGVHGGRRVAWRFRVEALFGNPVDPSLDVGFGVPAVFDGEDKALQAEEAHRESAVEQEVG